MIRVDVHGPVVHVRLARTALGRPLYWTGCYLVDELLVDCGPPATAGELLGFLADRPVGQLVLTHHHEDHVGAAAALRARRGLVARIHPRGQPLLGQGFPQELYRRVAWGRTARVAAEPLGPALETPGARFLVLETPGHSLDHVCLFEPERGWLFSGDLFLAERLRYLRADEDLLALIESLEAVARLPLRQVFCAHRGLVPDGPAALRRKGERLRELRERVREGLVRGDSQRQLARRLVGREGALTFFSLGHFSARNFVRAVARGR